MDYKEADRILSCTIEKLRQERERQGPVPEAIRRSVRRGAHDHRENREGATLPHSRGLPAAGGCLGPAARRRAEQHPCHKTEIACSKRDLSGSFPQISKSLR